jgi:hypothetical protein
MKKSLLATAALVVAATATTASPASATAQPSPRAATANQVVSCDLGGARGSLDLTVSRKGSLATITTSRYMMQSPYLGRHKSNIKIWGGAKIIAESDDALEQDGAWHPLTLQGSTGGTSIGIEFVFDVPGSDTHCDTQVTI